MSRVYAEQHRTLQDQFESRKMADRLEELIVSDELDEGKIAFIQAQDMFFLTTIDHEGQPSVSHKGGPTGFVKVIDSKTIAFPSYDGNGMFFSMGNISNNPKVGLLFIDFQTPNRVRFHGEATVSADDPLMAEYKEAELIVRVKATKVWINCPRYIHRYQKVEPSRYVPCEENDTPLAEWKRVDLVQDVLFPKDVGRPEEAGGVITIEEWVGNVQKGKG